MSLDRTQNSERIDARNNICLIIFLRLKVSLELASILEVLT